MQIKTSKEIGLKVIFLDIDGVLNILGTSYRTYAESDNIYPLEQHLVKRLEFVCDRVPDAKIMISSAWSLRDVKNGLKKFSFKYVNRVIDRTPRSKYFRGEQIKDSITKYKLKSTEYIVLEDEISDVCGDKCDIIPKDNVVEVNMSNGLSDADAVNCVKLLNKEEIAKYKVFDNVNVCATPELFNKLCLIGFRPQVSGTADEILDRFNRMKLNIETLTLQMSKE